VTGADDMDVDVELEADSPTFVQVPNGLVDAGASPMALATYVQLRRFASWNTGRVHFSLQVLAHRMGLKQARSVRPYVEELERLGYLTVREQHGENGARLRNLYVVRLTPLRSTAPAPCAPPHHPPAVDRTASTDDLGTDDLGTKSAPAALIPAPDDVVADEWRRLREADGHRPGTVTAATRKSLQLLIRNVGVDRVLQVVGWMHAEGRGRWWLDTRGLTLGQLRKSWASLDAQCPPDWERTLSQDELDARAHAAVLQHAGITDAEWAALDSVARQEVRWAAEDAQRERALREAGYLPATAGATSVDDWDPSEPWSA